MHFFFHKQNQYKGGFSDNVIQTANVHSSHIISSSCQSIVKIQDEEGKKTKIKSLRCCQKFQKYVAEPLYNDFLGIANDYFTSNCLIYRKEPLHNKTLLQRTHFNSPWAVSYISRFDYIFIQRQGYSSSGGILFKLQFHNAALIEAIKYGRYLKLFKRKFKNS